ncbi:histone acetyltransferase KAT6A isoform X2 [Drosophila subobscura]|uniref:histone acetyltransferase KAT6A isoform X2 n=1 Tax=Drosophila subobscura TaxID=7241 RepID=UPI00155AC9A2|nr:histone acetyltransferase KAT6A isoform X2 [Drosophila subobscura]
MAKRYLSLVMLLLLQCIWATPQRTAAYSLQAAVDELHRREAAKYPLNAPPPLDDWEDDLFGKSKNRNRHRVNKVLAKYLERDSDDFEPDRALGPPFSGYDFGPGAGAGASEDVDNGRNNLFADEKRKRFSATPSLFRERDEQLDAPAPSVFRERAEPLSGEPTHNELADQFLREIEEAGEQERNERYKDAVRQWWHHFDQRQQLAKDVQQPQQQQQLQQEQNLDPELFEQKKRMRVPPYYLLMQKKRSYPVLPWLPYNADKKKRFPVAKRAIGSNQEKMPLGKTDERVAQELSELFGNPVDSHLKPHQEQSDEKKKRSADEPNTTTTAHVPEMPAATTTALGDMRLEINFQRVNVTKEKPATAAPPAAGAGEMVQHGGHAGHHGNHVPGMGPVYRHRKRSDHVHHRDSDEHDVDEHDDEGEESSDEDDHDEFDEDEGEVEPDTETDAEERRRKKKRAAVGGGAHSKHLRAPTVGHLMLRAKKSIDWSQYFGLDLDRKKKSAQITEQTKKRLEEDSTNNNSNNNNEEEEPEEEEEEEKKKKRDMDPEKLESMDRKLQSIEDFIIDETIKYTGAHEGVNSREDIRKIKDHVLSRLATAYSLEKMRRALDKLRQSVDNDNHLIRNTIEPESEENTLEHNYWTAKKRYSVKKEQADEAKPAQDMEKRKRSGYLRYPEQPNNMEEALAVGSVPYETLNDAYLGNKNYIIGSNQCPVIESMAERCRGVDLISGDINQELLPLCGVHQICYLCGASQVACDYQYLAEADSICGSSNDCQSAARSILMILRGTPGRQLGPRECLKNPCLYRAMREIGL